MLYFQPYRVEPQKMLHHFCFPAPHSLSATHTLENNPLCLHALYRHAQPNTTCIHTHTMHRHAYCRIGSITTSRSIQNQQHQWVVQFMGFMYSYSNIKQVLFSVATLVAYMYTYTHTTKSTSVFVPGSSHDFCASQRCRRTLLQSIFTPYMSIATGICTASPFFFVLEHH